MDRLGQSIGNILRMIYDEIVTNIWGHVFIAPMIIFVGGGIYPQGFWVGMGIR